MSNVRVYTTDLLNISPEIYKLTIPKIEEYAIRIGADFFKISQRKFEEFGDFYEKMQIFELGKDYDYNIYISPEVILNDNMIDMTQYCPKDSVGHWGAYGASSWFQIDNPFLQDMQEMEEIEIKEINGESIIDKKIIICQRDLAFNDSILCVPKDCHDVWKPTELPYEVAITFAGRQNWLGEWNLARNCAKYHFKHTQLKSTSRKDGAQHDLSCFLSMEIVRNKMSEQESIDKAKAYLEGNF